MGPLHGGVVSTRSFPSFLPHTTQAFVLAPWGPISGLFLDQIQIPFATNENRINIHCPRPRIAIGLHIPGASGHYLGTSKPKKAYVVSDRELDDYTIHNAITAELQKRGFRVIDSRDHAPASVSNSLVVHYLDHWNFDLIWLPVMYLSSLNIRIIDGNSSEVLATAPLQCRDEYFSTLTDTGRKPVYAARPAEPAARSRCKLKTESPRRDSVSQRRTLQQSKSKQKHISITTAD